MKYITKRAEPQSFINWKQKPNVDFKKLGNKRKVKKQLRTSLMEEQGFICCYCERSLIEGDCHIEHFRPKDQNKFPELELEYDNLICSCQANLEKGTPRHCGNSKENWFDDNLISPLDIDCESKFKYTHDGQILPINEDDEATKLTIEKLQLNIDKLKDLRKSVIDALFEDEDVSWYLEMKDGRYNEFYTTINYLF